MCDAETEQLFAFSFHWRRQGEALFIKFIFYAAVFLFIVLNC